MNNKEFETHVLNLEGKKEQLEITLAFDALLDALVTICPQGRELALVRTKLEEASFFAKKSAALKPENWEPST